MSNTFSKNCPKCKGIQTYSSFTNLGHAIKRNSVCKSCRMMGSGNPRYGKIGTNFGKIFTTEHRKNLSESHVGTQCGPKNGMYGKRFKHSPQVIIKISLASKGKHISDSQRKLQSEFMRGEHNPSKHLSPEQKMKRRVAFLHRKEKLGLPACVDRGANEFFHWLNSIGFNFKPQRFLELGYEADGYDADRHIWLEYDTPYHSSLRQREKDLIREQNIITHFESIGNPLSGFIRVKHDLTTKCKYKGRRI